MRLRTLAEQVQEPAAGGGFTVQFSQIQAVRLRSMMFTLNTDAVAGTRQVWAQIQDINGVPVFESGYNVGQGVSLIRDYVLCSQFGQTSTIQGPLHQAQAIPFPDEFFPPGWQLVVGATALDAGDQFLNISYAAVFAEPKWFEEEHDAEVIAALAALG